MRTLTALALVLAAGAGASLYTPAAHAGVYVQVGLPVPGVAACVTPGYYGPAPCVAPALGFGPAWAPAPVVYGYGHWDHGHWLRGDWDRGHWDRDWRGHDRGWYGHRR